MAFAAVYGQVLSGGRLLVAGDVLYCCPPWNGSRTAHSPTNPLLADPMDQFLPWLSLVENSFASGQLPLWDPYALSGKPLLANDQAAPFSLFTLTSLLFGGAWGYSLAMLLKMWVAAVGTAVLLRLYHARPLAAGVAAISYATSSFMVLWLAWPQAGVAALLPWVFAMVEWYLQRPSTLAAAAVAVTVALQFLSGHAETSLFLGVGTVLYSGVRALDGRPGRAFHLATLAGVGLLGSALASVQLLPFLVELSRSSLAADRAAVAFGSAHLPLTDLTSWIAPNLRGNPAVDGLPGRLPNYNESTGFAGVAALVLSAVQVLAGWNRRTETAALATVGLFAVATVYTPFSHLLAQLPLFAVSGNSRMTVLVCLAVAALAGLGLDVLLERARRHSRVGIGLLAVGLTGLALFACTATAFALFRGQVEAFVPFHPRGWVGFWLLAAGVTLAGALGLTAGGWLTGHRVAAAGLAALTLLEGMLFAGPFQPQVRPGETPPPSSSLAWLRANAGTRPIAATGFSLLPETATLYGLRDVRGYDVVRSPRERVYWSHADPGYHDATLQTWLERPRPEWLAAAGVSYVLSPGREALAGTRPVWQGEGVTVGEVHNPRPVAFVAKEVKCVTGGMETAADEMEPAPLGPVVLETKRCPSAGQASVTVLKESPGHAEMTVTAKDPAVVVLLQSWDPDWRVTVDGRPAEAVPADVLFQAVEVPQGDHAVVFAYDPWSLRLGIWLSLAALLVVAALAIQHWMRWPRG